MGTEEPKNPLKGMDWKSIGGSVQNEPSAGPVTKKQLPGKIGQIPDYSSLPRKSIPSANVVYGKLIAAGIGAGMLAEICMNKKIRGL
ncbi:uncharacterized protein LOC132298999 isoform X2 [Cornus florida]|uniref:uncharacterized protein LOC132298999 isoform X2 n=1 Tax=Cornus florida TaxID=4283 RepID=UPI0028966E9E|nr:uncharacterized protein LOC132298999 isoform X2 [Cornus florida]